MPLIPDDIISFFESYRRAFDALDGEAIAQHYALPSGIALDTGYVHWPAFEPIRKNMLGLCNLYRNNGYLSAIFEPAFFIPQGENYAVIDLAWHIERSDKQHPWRFNTTYNLIRAPEGWRILLCTAHSEQRLDTAQKGTQ